MSYHAHELRAEVHRGFAADALLLPTTTRQPTLKAVAGDPFGVNGALGRSTRFANLLDLWAVTVPAGRADGGHFGVSVRDYAASDSSSPSVSARCWWDGQ